MKNIIILLLSIALLVSGAQIALTIRERNEARRELEAAHAAEAEAREKSARLEATTATLRKERDTAQSELKQAREAQVAAAGSGTGGTGAGNNLAAGGNTLAGGKSPAGMAGASGGKAGPATKPMKAMAEMMKNPAMREMIKQQQIAQMDMQYGGLMSRFQLSDEEKANFKQLLAERVQMESEIGVQMMDDGLSADQRTALMKQITESKKATEEKIRTFLNNDEDFQTYKQWEDSKPERMQLSMGQSLFSSAGEPLSQDQEQRLIDTMHQVRTTPKSTPDLSKPENFAPGNLTPSAIEKQLASFDTDAARVLQQAAGYLTPKQLETLKALQAQWRTLQKTGLEMSSMMIGGK